MKRILPWWLLVVLTLTLITPAKATDPVFAIDWDQKLGALDADFANSIIPVQDGGYIAVGVEGRGNDLSYFVVKLDAEGSTTWERTISLSLTSEYAYDVVDVGDGYIIIGQAMIQSPGSSRPWLLKLDRDGNTVWSTEDSLTQSVAVDSGIIIGAAAPDGKVFVAGGSNTMTNPQDPWILVVDGHGDQVLFRELEPLATGFGQGTFVLDIVATADGGFALTGTVSPPSLGEAFLWKFDAAGHEEWSQTYGDRFFRTAHSVQLTATGEYLLTGCSLSNCRDVAILKADRDGEPIWYKEIPDSEHYSQGWDTIERSDGSIILLQQRFAAFGTTTFASDLLLLSADGEQLHRLNIPGGANSTALRRLHLTSDGLGWIAVGNSNESTNGSETDFYIVKGTFLDMATESPFAYKIWLPIITR